MHCIWLPLRIDCSHAYCSSLLFLSPSFLIKFFFLFRYKTVFYCHCYYFYFSSSTCFVMVYLHRTILWKKFFGALKFSARLQCRPSRMDCACPVCTRLTLLYSNVKFSLGSSTNSPNFDEGQNLWHTATKYFFGHTYHCFFNKYGQISFYHSNWSLIIMHYY